MDLASFQRLIRDTYGERDRDRGVPRTFTWLVEEVGELSRALFRGDDADRREEFSDVLAWLVSLADLAGVDVAAAVADRYGRGCPKCRSVPCRC
ncbi:MAG: pyrophosphohydrolase [Actinomycetota bacterium]|nr:pyrophosphohydrolase [Actinomycetota bacterium]